jgi:hypothetical protein
MRKEYDFSGGVVGKYAKRYAEATKVVSLDPDVANAFPDSKSVNEALRSLVRVADRRKAKKRPWRNAQILTIALATVPTMITVLIGILINSSRLSDLRSYMDVRFNNVDRRFDEMKETWRSELHRVEGVLDARLKHLEERWFLPRTIRRRWTF